MLNKFVYTVLLVLLLSMGSMFSQEATPPPAPPAPSGRVALTLEERVEGFELSALQVGNTCVPPLYGRYTLNLKVPEVTWAAKVADVPSNLAEKLPLGNFNPETWVFYTFSQRRMLRSGLSSLFSTNGYPSQGLFILTPEFWNWSQEPSATCGPALDFWEIPIALVGQPEPGILMGVGPALKSTNVDQEGGIRFEVVSWNQTDVLIFQERVMVGLDGVEKKYTYQRAFETPGRGTFKIEIAPGWAMSTGIRIHLRDKRTNVSWTTDLLGGDRAYRTSGGSVYNVDIPRYCAVFTGNTECKLPDETELRSRSAEETPNLKWFWELTGRQAPARR